MIAGAKFGVTIPSHVQPTIGEHDTYMSAFGACPLCRREQDDPESHQGHACIMRGTYTSFRAMSGL